MRLPSFGYQIGAVKTLGKQASGSAQIYYSISEHCTDDAGYILYLFNVGVNFPEHASSLVSRFQIKSDIGQGVWRERVMDGKPIAIWIISFTA